MPRVVVLHLNDFITLGCIISCNILKVLSITRRFLKGRQNGRQFVPVDTKTVSLKLLVLLVMICDWCLWQVN